CGESAVCLTLGALARWTYAQCQPAHGPNLATSATEVQSASERLDPLAPPPGVYLPSAMAGCARLPAGATLYIDWSSQLPRPQMRNQRARHGYAPAVNLRTASDEWSLHPYATIRKRHRARQHTAV